MQLQFADRIERYMCLNCATPAQQNLVVRGGIGLSITACASLAVFCLVFYSVWIS